MERATGQYDHLGRVPRTGPRQSRGRRSFASRHWCRAAPRRSHGMGTTVRNPRVESAIGILIRTPSLAVFADFRTTKRPLLGNQPIPPTFPRYPRRACMASDPEEAADRHARAVIMAIFAVISAVAIVAACVTTLEGTD